MNFLQVILNVPSKMFCITLHARTHIYTHGIICIVFVTLKLYRCPCMRSYYDAWYIKREVYSSGVFIFYYETFLASGIMLFIFYERFSSAIIF